MYMHYYVGKKLDQIYQQLHWTSIEKQSIVLGFFLSKLPNIILL